MVEAVNLNDEWPGHHFIEQIRGMDTAIHKFYSKRSFPKLDIDIYLFYSL
jgi:hypothetical protein